MKRTPRIYLQRAAFSSEGVVLSKSAKHYLKKVLRKTPGDEFCALDGEGEAWLCELRDPHCPKIGDYPAVAPLPLKLTMGVALCKPSRFEDAVGQLAELGVHSLIPLITDRVDNKNPSINKLQRWAEIAKSASAVAMRAIPLYLEECKTLRQFVEESDGNLAYCHPGGSVPREFFEAGCSELRLAVGPEGGFTEAETTLLAQHGQAVGLGPHNLRVATAATAIASLALI